MDRIEALKAHVETFPLLPGVYVMRAGDGSVLYVGKALELRARVRSYLASPGGDGRIQIPALMQRVVAIETIVTDSEQQAFVLERDLIQKYKPRYNVRLKDDKAFLFVRIDPNVEWPRLELVRKRSDDGARYYGPFSSSAELRRALDIIKRTIPLRTCSDVVLYNRSRPCLEYQIKRCCAPCCLPVVKSEYTALVKQAGAVLQGNVAGLQQALEESMERAAQELRFEDAATIRDRIETLASIKSGQRLHAFSGGDRDIFALYREEGLAALSVLQVRNGRLNEGAHYTFTEVEVSDELFLEQCISQYYGTISQEIPAEILVPHLPENTELLATGLSERRGKSVELRVPERAMGARLLALAQTNARTAFGSRFDAAARYQAVATTLAQRIGSRQVPRRIECVDISNFQGSDTVGAIVCFYDGQTDKQRYRKYKLTGYDAPDDFAAIYEVVSRRLARGKKENDLPDLLIIDGGAQQLAKALEAQAAVGTEIDIVALAKQRTDRDAQAAEIQKSQERFFLPHQSEPVLLAESDPVTLLVARIRDEAHRYVITFHRQSRGRRIIGSQLDSIGGVRKEMRTRLLKHFGSIQKISSASEEEVARIGRMPLSLARKVLLQLRAPAGESTPD